MRKGIVAGVAAVAVVAVVGAGALASGALGQRSAQAGTAASTTAMPGWASAAAKGAQDAKSAAANAAIDNLGVKQAVNQALLDHSADIAAQTGVSQSTVESAIGQMDVPDWQVTSVPASAKAQSTNSFSADGVTADVTTYDDPSVVSVATMGQSVAFSVPQSAQPYVGYLSSIS